MRAAFALSALALVACAPEPAPPVPLQFDCAAGFETLSARIAAEPALHQAPPQSGEPYRFYSAGDGSVSYVVTLPDAPAHPAVFRQRAAPGGAAAGMVNDGCRYGGAVAYDQLAAYLAALKAR